MPSAILLTLLALAACGGPTNIAPSGPPGQASQVNPETGQRPGGGAGSSR